MNGRPSQKITTRLHGPAATPASPAGRCSRPLRSTPGCCSSPALSGARGRRPRCLVRWQPVGSAATGWAAATTVRGTRPKPAAAAVHASVDVAVHAWTGLTDPACARF